MPAEAHSGELQSVRAKAQALAANIAALDARIDAAVLRRTRAADSLAAVRGQIGDTTRLQSRALRDLDGARATLALRAVALYKNDDVSTLDAILTADRALSLVADERTAGKLVAQRDAELKRIKGQLGERQALLTGVRAEIRNLAAKQKAATPTPAETVAPPSGGGGDDGDGGGDAGGGQGQWWPLIQQAAGANGVSARGMYRLMMIESGGYASIVGPGGYYGLFQYAPVTWKASWNPYRAASITDGAAQISATALALKRGNGSWWEPSYSWAFAGQ